VADAFDNILGQPMVRDFLRATVEDNHVSHAYFFAGAPGSNKTLAATSFAQALLCPKGAHGPRGGKCGSCDVCGRVGRHLHPDVHLIYPEGAGGYLIEQIRELVADVARAPIQANRKVYILQNVEKLGVSCANAFLKTLEEPPADVVFILLGRDGQSVIDTIASRCQVVSFRHIPPAEAAGIVSQNTGAELALSRAAIDAAGGSITGAVAFLNAKNNERVSFRAKLIGGLGRIASMGDWEIIEFAREVVLDSKAPLDDLEAEQQADIEDARDFLSASVLKRIEARNKRRMSADTIKYLKQTFAIIESWLRDCAYVLVGQQSLIVNKDFESQILHAAMCMDLDKISCAFRALEELERALDYNVSSESCIEAALFRVREVTEKCKSHR
jgi:DNA polymerase-3 subunit delta'